ncbi:MAG TPA: SpoIID/LytB domain-containing protein [Gemmatimonadales bacterium]|nr:SpoIID/LytB domain-containing protein [Gemmatimonadales bacterium]
MATIAADCRLPAVGLAFAFAAGCATPPAPIAPPPGPATAEPLVQVGLAVGSSAATVGGDAALMLTRSDGGPLVEIPPAQAWRAIAAPRGVSIAPSSGGPAVLADRVVVQPVDSQAWVRVNGRSYRGTIVLQPDRTGLTIVNRVRMEAYLLGVVSAEMGRRAAEDREAVRAQAVVSRTYALRNLGRWRSEGFDLYATVFDQVYGGAGAETPEARDAVESTRGQVLTWNGGPIDSFFFSTCGGRTESGVDVFRGADVPYLRSVSDQNPNGIAYCSLSPRFRWREEWTGDGLRTILRRSLPTVLGIQASRVDQVQDLRIVQRTGSDRVGLLSITLGHEAIDVEGPKVRQVLRTPAGEMLRSTAFTLEIERTGARVSRVVAQGGGNGHGVGLCQWGAVGRARAGQNYQQILAAYYGGSELTRWY